MMPPERKLISVTPLFCTRTGSASVLVAPPPDVAAFLMWAAEPHLDARKRTGLQVLIFLVILSVLLYFTKKKIWHEIEKPTEVAKGQDPRATTT